MVAQFIVCENRSEEKHVIKILQNKDSLGRNTPAMDEHGVNLYT